MVNNFRSKQKTYSTFVCVFNEELNKPKNNFHEKQATQPQ